MPLTNSEENILVNEYIKLLENRETDLHYVIEIESRNKSVTKSIFNALNIYKKYKERKSLRNSKRIELITKEIYSLVIIQCNFEIGKMLIRDKLVEIIEISKEL